MPVTSAANLFGGPAYVAIGDPTTSGGADMVDLGLVPRVEVTPTFRRQGVNNEVGQLLESGQWGMLQGANIALTLQNKSATILAALFSEITDATSSVKFSNTFAQLTLHTMAIMPETSYGNGTTDTGLIWVPAARPNDLGPFIYKLEESEDSDPYTINFSACFRASDQDSTSITTDYNILWMGDPSDAGVPTWTLPSGY